MQKKYVFFFCLFFLFSCKNTPSAKHKKADSPSEGTTKISVDESFKPIIDQQIKVYESSYPETKIIVEYKPEVACIKDLEKDSTRMIIIARPLTAAEGAAVKQNEAHYPLEEIIAYDAVGLIVNKANPDSFFTIKRLKTILSGVEPISVIVDGNNATSTVRYLKDSILKDKPFGKNVRAVEGSAAVIDKIAQDKTSIGFVGSSWFANYSDPAQLALQQHIQPAWVECKFCTEKNLFAKPSQNTLTLGQYPLFRPIYLILKENYVGLATGFKNFLTLERGQLIFRRGSIVPAKMNFKQRSGVIK